MRKQALAVEWVFVENDADWQRLRAPLLPDNEPTAHRHRLLKRYFWSVTTLLLLLTGAGNRWWRTTRAALPQLAAAVTATAQAPLGTVVPGREALVASVIGDQTATDWWRQGEQAEGSLRAALQNNAPAAHVDIAVPMMEFHGDQAVVSIVTAGRSGAPAHRQTRFYRRTDGGWLRTDPDAALWGPERSLETTFFVFHFRQNDVQAVITVVPQVDALYTTMRRNFGLPISSVDQPTMFLGEKLVIDVSVTQPPSDAFTSLHAPDRIRVPSPAVSLAPVALTDADLLAQSVALPLLEQVLAQASEHHAIGGSWQPLLNGLYLWQVWDLDLPLSAWREEVVQWIYVGLPANQHRPPLVLPDRYSELCAAHKLWLLSPVQIHIPLLCGDLDHSQEYLYRWASGGPPTRLTQLTAPWPAMLSEGPNQANHPSQAVALATLVEYVVATYGRERLPVLVAGLGQSESWDTLLPAVYGVSPAEFEAGWQAYVAAHYGAP